MRDYDELIKDLREYAELVDHDMWDCPYMIADSMKQAADAIEDLIAALTASNEVIAKSGNRWIRVEDRCPEKYGDYLVFDDCRNLYVNEWHCLLHKWQYDDGRITHWTQLPEPPKEEIK